MSESGGGNVLTLNPYPMSCKLETFKTGPLVMVKNAGTKVIPAGSLVTVKWPDGTTSTKALSFDLGPGVSVGLWNPPKGAAPGFHCSASVKVN